MTASPRPYPRRFGTRRRTEPGKAVERGVLPAEFAKLKLRARLVTAVAVLMMAVFLSPVPFLWVWTYINAGERDAPAAFWVTAMWCAMVTAIAALVWVYARRMAWRLQRRLAAESRHLSVDPGEAIARRVDDDVATIGLAFGMEPPEVIVVHSEVPNVGYLPEVDVLVVTDELARGDRQQLRCAVAGQFARRQSGTLRTLLVTSVLSHVSAALVFTTLFPLYPIVGLLRRRQDAPEVMSLERREYARLFAVWIVVHGSLWPLSVLWFDWLIPVTFFGYLFVIPFVAMNSFPGAIFSYGARMLAERWLAAKSDVYAVATVKLVQPMIDLLRLVSALDENNREFDLGLSNVRVVGVPVMDGSVKVLDPTSEKKRGSNLWWSPFFLFGPEEAQRRSLRRRIDRMESLVSRPSEVVVDG